MFFGNKFKKSSFSQCGEDRIIEFIFEAMGIHMPTYIDIGAHHPFYLSNTALLYSKGSSGICIEPDPVLFQKIKQKRKRDTCLNIGVGLDSVESAKFYIMSTPSLNTFSQEEAERVQGYGTHKIIKVIDVPLVNINAIVQKYGNGCVNLVSLDVEGLDFQILKSFDFDGFRPEVLCVETLTYTEDSSERKLVEIIEFMNEKNYLTYADTYINTIFVDKARWLARGM